MAITISHFCVLLLCLACIGMATGRPGDRLPANNGHELLHGTGDPSFDSDLGSYLDRTPVSSPSQHAFLRRLVGSNPFSIFSIFSRNRRWYHCTTPSSSDPFAHTLYKQDEKAGDEWLSTELFFSTSYIPLFFLSFLCLSAIRPFSWIIMWYRSSKPSSATSDQVFYTSLHPWREEIKLSRIRLKRTTTDISHSRIHSLQILPIHLCQMTIFTVPSSYTVVTIPAWFWSHTFWQEQTIIHGTDPWMWRWMPRIR